MQNTFLVSLLFLHVNGIAAGLIFLQEIQCRVFVVFEIQLGVVWLQCAFFGHLCFFGVFALNNFHFIARFLNVKWQFLFTFP